MSSEGKMLGKIYPPGSAGSIKSFNDLPDSLVEDARKLACEHKSLLGAACFLQHYVSMNDGYDRFIEEVLINDTVKASDWGKEDSIFYPSSKKECYLKEEFKALLAPLKEMPGERWFRIIPLMREWTSFSTSTGAPGVVVRSAPYWMRSAEYISDHGFMSCNIARLAIEPVDEPDLQVAICRWIASRIARDLKRERPSEVDSLTKICAVFKVRADELSLTSRTAIAGLLSSGWPHHQFDSTPPGFTGSDALYRTPIH